MSRATAWTVHVAICLVAASGLGLCWLVFLADVAGTVDPVTPEELVDEELRFAVVHPWHAPVAAIHILAAPLAVFAIGAIWRGHVWPRLRGTATRERRRTGMVLAATFAPLVVAGYLLQVVVEETARPVLSWTHAGLGLLLALAYAAHQLRPRTRPIRSRARRTPPESS